MEDLQCHILENKAVSMQLYINVRNQKITSDKA